jgi:hypothetical protein
MNCNAAYPCASVDIPIRPAVTSGIRKKVSPKKAAVRVLSKKTYFGSIFKEYHTF